MRNLLALFHLAIIPIMIYLISRNSDSYTYSAIMVLSFSIMASIIEWLYLKKKRDRESFLRPFADKLLVLTVLLFLAFWGKFNWLVLSLFIFRDLLAGTIRLRAARENVIIKSRWPGKIITICEISLIFSVLIMEYLRQAATVVFVPTFQLIQFSLIIVAMIISIYSITDYILIYGQKISARKRNWAVINNENMIILANRKSGGFRDGYRRHLLKLFARRRKARIVFLPQTTEMFKGIGKIIKPFQQVIIAGGDGSFESALNHPLFKGKSLGFFPLGAGNSYYSYFYKGKRFEYLRSRFKFREIPLDILGLKFNGQKVQTTFLSLGIDAEVIKQTKNVTDHNFADYFKAAAKVAFGPRLAYSLLCEADGRKYQWDNCFNLIISKIPFIGYGLKATIGDIDSDDGLILGLAQVNTHAPFFNKGLRLWCILLTQLGLNKAPLVPLIGKTFKIKSGKPFSLQAGGEFLGSTAELSVEVLRKQKVLMI